MIKEYEYPASAIGNEYNAGAYPHDGVFYNAATNSTYVRYTPPNCGPCVMAVINYRFSSTEQKPEQVGIGVSDVATLLAVALHRDAAIEQVKK